MAFCIDFSGSMSAKMTKVSSDYAGEGKTLKDITRMEMVKEELFRVVKSLKADTYFNIIGFETNIKKWRDGQVQATPENRDAAVSWITALQPTGGTNIYDALEEAFGLASGKYAMTPDTIFLLSDGSPGSGKITNANEILAEIARINRTRNVVINTIGVGTGGEAFLKSLAEQNGGIYRSAGE
jgi:Mg-chelatase subunit ChlD